MKKKFNSRKELDNELARLEQREQAWKQRAANWRQSVKPYARIQNIFSSLIDKEKKSGIGVVKNILSRFLYLFKSKGQGF